MITSDLVPIGAVNKAYVDIMEKSCSHPRFYTILTGYEIDPKLIRYKIEFGMSRPYSNVEVKTIYTRYSILLKLYKAINKLHPKFSNKFKFPSKRWFNNNTIETANYRMSILAPFIQQLNQIPDIQSIKEFNDIFDISD